MGHGKWMLAGLTVCMLVLSGCDDTGDGSALGGTWKGPLPFFYEGTHVAFSIASSQSAEFTFDQGFLTMTYKPGFLLVNWLFKVVVNGTYTVDDSGNINKMTMSLDRASLKFMNFSFSLKELGLKSDCIYEVKGLTTLYILPDYDKLSDDARASIEATAPGIPWESIGENYHVMKLTRVG